MYISVKISPLPDAASAERRKISCGGFVSALSSLPTNPADIELYGAFGALCALPAAAILAEENRRKTASRGNSINGGNKCTFP